VKARPLARRARRSSLNVCDWAALANVVTVFGLPLAVFALAVAIKQLVLARRATAAGVLVPLHESFRQTWLHFVSAKEEDERTHAFADIFNLVELGCAVSNDGLLRGRSGALLVSYLRHVLAHIQSSDDARTRMEASLHTERSYENIAAFLRKHKGQITTAS
jgi:hypothetical protein